MSDLIQKINKAGAEVLLYNGVVVTRPEGKVPAVLRAEILKRSKELKAELAAKIAADRSAAGRTHKWVLRLGDVKSRGSDAPLKSAYLACGPVDWCEKMVRQAQELSDPTNKYEKNRWLILDQDHVGAPIRDERDVLVASLLVLPENVKLGGPPDSKAEIVSACLSCLVPPVTDERTAEIIKNDT